MNDGSNSRRPRKIQEKSTWHDQLFEKTSHIGISNFSPIYEDDLSSEIDFEGTDDLNQLKILRMMAAPAYIMACYINALEISNVLNKDERSYNCTCLLESSKEDFHYCPANKKFEPSSFCRQHIECNDPIYAVFDLAQQCSAFTNKVPEFGEECKEIAEKAVNLSVELLNQCSNTREAETLLGEKAGLAKVFKSISYDHETNSIKYPRLIGSIELNHKEFVSHMYCQQILRRQWQGGIKWQGQSFFYKVCKNFYE